MITAPKPGALTLEQIGRNETPPTWIKKIEFDRKTLNFKEQNEISLDIPIRIYYENRQERSRIMTSAKVTVTSNDNEMQVHVLVPQDEKVISSPIELSGTLITFSS